MPRYFILLYTRGTTAVLLSSLLCFHYWSILPHAAFLHFTQGPFSPTTLLPYMKNSIYSILSSIIFHFETWSILPPKVSSLLFSLQFSMNVQRARNCSLFSAHENSRWSMREANCTSRGFWRRMQTSWIALYARQLSKAPLSLHWGCRRKRNLLLPVGTERNIPRKKKKCV